MSPRLTPHQAALVAFIRAYHQARGYPPTLRELADHFGATSTNGVRTTLAVLARKGVLIRDRGCARGLRLLEPAPSPDRPG